MERTQEQEQAWLQEFVNDWAGRYSLAMSDQEVINSLQTYCLGRAKDFPPEDAELLLAVASFVCMLEVRLGQGWNIEVSFNDGNWNVCPVMPAGLVMEAAVSHA